MEMKPVQQGWQCPICGRILSPWTWECPCGGNGGRYTTSDRTNLKPNGQIRMPLKSIKEQENRSGERRE